MFLSAIINVTRWRQVWDTFWSCWRMLRWWVKVAGISGGPWRWMARWQGAGNRQAPSTESISSHIYFSRFCSGSLLPPLCDNYVSRCLGYKEESPHAALRIILYCRKTDILLLCNYIPLFLNLLTPNDPYRGRTAPLTSKRYILFIYSTNIGTEYFKHGVFSPFFSSKCNLFHNSNVFGSCVIHILYTGVLNLKKIIPAPKG